MSFTLHKETVQDFMKHAFDSEPDEKNMMRGFTPFCLQQMDKASKIKLEKIEERIATQTYTSSTDLLKRDQALKFTPIRDPYSFVTEISNTHALAYILFTEHSPLTQGLQQLLDTVMAGFHNQRLRMVGAAQPDWFSHVLWAVYEKCYDFFQMKLSEEDLLEGAMLINPLTILNGRISEFEKIERPSCPESLLTSSPTFSPMPTQQDSGGYVTNKNGKQKGQGGGGNPGGDKKVKTKEGEEVQHRQNFWNGKKVFHASLKAAKQEIIEKNGRTQLGQLAKANKQGVASLLNSMGLHPARCARYTLWGGCGDVNCKLNHNDYHWIKTKLQ